MKRVRFVAPARRGLLSEVAYYNDKELGLSVRLLAAIEDATARALVYPLTGSPASKNTRRMFLKAFPFPLCIDLMTMESLSLHLLNTHVAQGTGGTS